MKCAFKSEIRVGLSECAARLLYLHLRPLRPIRPILHRAFVESKGLREVEACRLECARRSWTKGEGTLPHHWRVP